MNTEKNELSQLRETVLKHQRKEAYEQLSTLFLKDIPRFTVLVANHMERSYLRFSSQSDIAWVGSLAKEVTQYVQDGYLEDKKPSYPREADGSYTDAPHGMTNLVGGAIELWKSVSVADDTRSKGQHLSVAINEIIIAEIGHYWEAVHLDDLQLREMFSDAPITPDGKKILPNDVDKEKLYRGIGFLKQPESVAYHSARLLSIIDELELILTE